MLRAIMQKTISIFIATLFLSHPAFAVLKPAHLLGEIKQLQVAGKRPELCAIPPKLTSAKYAKNDERREKELCSYNVGATIAGCAKLNSTNPGVDFMLPKSGSGFALANCTAEGMSKRAKYKLSSSCSYTPAILAYYHFSRALGNVLNVPTSVARTMDLDRHLTIGNHALHVMRNKKGELIYKTWSSLMSSLNAGRKSRNADLLFVEGYDQSYGALSWNPKGELFYKEFFNGGVDRAATFKQKNPIYRALVNPATKVGREFTASNVQAMQQLKDLSNMLVIDTVLGQQDRFGNIHFETKYYFPVRDANGFKVSSVGDFKEVPEALKPRAVAAKEMVLKDNDCGVAKENKIKAARLLDGIAHISPETYKRVLELERAGDANREFFQRVLLFTDADYRKVMTNLKEMASMLKSACNAGKLKLDLDMDLHFSGAQLPTRFRCEI